MLRAISASVLALTIVSGSIACSRIRREQPLPPTVWIIAPDAVISIDSTSLRPVVPAGTPQTPISARLLARIALITSYQGSRYHPETVRSLTDDQQVMATAAAAIGNAARMVGGGLFIDFQNASPTDIQKVAAISRAIADSARARGIGPVGIVVPPGDTVAYPTLVLAHAADLIVVRLHGEHRPGTPAGPLSSPEWIVRQLGMRSVDIGAGRLVAELPLFGFLWDANGGARRVTFTEAQSLVAAESGSFRRDETSGLLTATGRDGWTVWVPDAQSIVSMVKAVRTTGVNRIALTGIDGADPAVWTRLSHSLEKWIRRSRVRSDIPSA